MSVASSTLAPYPRSKIHRADGEPVYEISFDHESRREYGRGAIRRLGGIPALVEAANVVLRGHDAGPSLSGGSSPEPEGSGRALRQWLENERRFYDVRHEEPEPYAGGKDTWWGRMRVLVASARA